VILGAGEHARVVADAIRSRPEAWELDGLVDRAGEAGLTERLGSTSDVDAPALVLGFGSSSAARAAAVDRFDPRAEWAIVVHASATIAPATELRPGAVVLAGAVVNAGATVGRHAIVNSGAIVEHDVHLGDFVQVAPGATLGGGTVVGDAAHIGLGAAVRDHVTIGARATVGMGAVVIADVPADTLVVGNPARIVERSADD